MMTQLTALAQATAGAVVAAALATGSVGPMIATPGDHPLSGAVDDREQSSDSPALATGRAGEVDQGDAATDGAWVWPVESRDVARDFDPPEERWSRGHRGLDIRIPAGAAVIAVDDGVVSHSGVINGLGTITVRHGPGLRSTYQPVEDPAPVGTDVSAGQQIATLASDGHCPPSDCLHLGAIVDRDTYVDPMMFLRPGEVSLLPIDGR